jgi:hypothetical protein
MHDERSGFLGKVGALLGVVISILTLLRMFGFNIGTPTFDPIAPPDYIPAPGINGPGETFNPIGGSGQQGNGIAPEKPTCVTIPLIAPSPGATLTNPVHFEWVGVAGFYYRLTVYDAEPEPDYRQSSGWLMSNSMDLTILDTGIGNLEWYVECAADQNSGSSTQSVVGRFVYDPFYLHKTRQADGGG